MAMIRQKPKKNPMTDFVSMIVPERIEEAYDRVDEYFTEHLKLSFETPEGVTTVLNELIRDHGEPVRKALYAMLCEQDSALRKMTITTFADSGTAAVGQLVPILVAQFSLAPAVALLVATLVVKAVSAHGEQAVCEGMILQHRKVARGIRAREHAAATSAQPKARRRIDGAGAPRGSIKGSKKASSKRIPARAGKSNPVVTGKPFPKHAHKPIIPAEGQPSPKSARKPYPPAAEKPVSADASEPKSSRKPKPESKPPNED